MLKYFDIILLQKLFCEIQMSKSNSKKIFINCSHDDYEVLAKKIKEDLEANTQG